MAPLPHSHTQVETQPDTAAGFFKALSDRSEGHSGKQSSKHAHTHTLTQKHIPAGRKDILNSVY